MGYAKSYFVLKAFEEIGYAAYIYDVSPEQQNSALETLDDMVAGWNAIGIRLGYPLPSSAGQSSLDQDTNVPDSARLGLIAKLAIAIAPRFGKTVSAETKATAKQFYDNLLVQLAQPIEQRYPTTMPLGAGNKPWRWTAGPFVWRGPQPVQAGNDGNIDGFVSSGWVTGNINWT